MREYRVLLEPEASRDLKSIYDFIASNDNESQAERFLRKLRKAIGSLNFMPWRCRRTLYADDENVRDMIVQGYTITYLIRDESVHVLAVFRQRA